MAELTITSEPGVGAFGISSMALGYAKETSNYREEVLDDDPLLFFSFDRDTWSPGSTSVPMFNLTRRDVDDVSLFDDSFDNTLRRLTGTFSYPTSSTAGLEFDNASAMVMSLNRSIAPGSIFSNLSALPSYIIREEKLISLEVWLKFGADSGTLEPLCVGGELISNTNGFRFVGQSDGTEMGIQMEAVTNVVYTAESLALTLNDGDWHHLVGTWDGTDLKFYADGVLEDTVTPPAATEILWPTTTSTTTNDSGFILKVGASIRSFTSSSVFFTFEGFMKNVALYVYPLTAAQVLSHYNAGTSTGSGFSVYVPAQPFAYARAEFPPHPTGDTYDVLGRIVSTITEPTAGAWKDAGGSSIVGAADNFSVTTRVARDADSSYSDRKVDFVTQMLNGAGDSLIQFGLCYDPRFSSSGNRAVKFAVYDGLTVEDALHPTAVGGLSSTPAVAGTWDFEWSPLTYYRFDIVDTGGGVALYVNNILVKGYTITPSGFDVESLALVTEDWQNYIDPVVHHDWMVFRADQGVDEYSLTEVTTSLNNTEWYESQTRDAVRVSDYILRHRIHTPTDQSNVLSAYTFTLNDELFFRRPTLGNTPGVEWIPVTNTIE